MDEKIAESDDRRTAAALTEWFLLTGNRLLVSFVVLFGIGALFVAAGVIGLVTVTRPSRVMWYLNGTVNGLLTLVPIAVGVNQIVLSHEFGSIRDYHDRRTNITEFRDRVERQTGMSARSPRTSAFFGTILATVSDTARGLQHDRPREDGRATDEITTVARSVSERADRANEELTASGTSTLRTLVVMLNYDNSRQFDELRQLRKESPDLSEETKEDVHELEELFVEIDTARQYLKTVVVERQLAQLSRLLIATGVPAVVIAALGIFTYRDVAGLTVPFTLLVIVAGALIVATLVPLVILAAYVLRVATIARRTAMYGPFVPESDY